MLSLLCEETYDLAAILTASQKSRAALIQALRTHNMYPPGSYIEEIANAILEMVKPGGNTSAEFVFSRKKDMFGVQEEEISDDDDDDDDSDDDDSGLGVDDLPR